MRQNHRNPRPVFELAEGLRGDGTVRSSRRGGAGIRPVDYRPHENDGQRSVLEEALGELSSQRIQPGRMAVVTMLRADRNPLFSPRRIGPWLELANPQLDAQGARLPLPAEQLPTPDPNRVYFDSVRRMKGLERGIIVLVDVPDPGPPASLERRQLYMGVTRATTYLSIIASAERIAQLRAIAGSTR